MIITDAPNDTKLDTSPIPGPSRAPPPAFEDYSHDTSLLVKDTHRSTSELELGPPPTFSEYQAESFVSNGNIITHDKHLNEDGEALYRFLLSQSTPAPSYLLSIRGIHHETRTRLVTGRDNHGNLQTITETYTETVVDFDFRIDIGRNAIIEPEFWSAPDTEPAFRGRSFQQIDYGPLGGRKKARRQDRKMSNAWKDEAREKGYPPWVGNVNRHATFAQMSAIGSLASSRSLRQWADDYCASKMAMKQFTFRKVMYGWDIDALKSAVRSTIHTTGYNGKLSVELETTGDLIIVRPDTSFSRILSKDRWTKFFLCVCLVYPIVWLYAWIVGGKWDICGVAFALKKIDANHDVNGIREGEWLRAWEDTIKHCVNLNRKDAVWILAEPISGATHLGLVVTSGSMGRRFTPVLHPSVTLDGYAS